MKLLRWLLVLCLPLSAQATPLTLTFFETGCTAPAIAVQCPAPQFITGSPQITFPYPLVELTIPDAPSFGSAIWHGGPSTPTFGGDPFTFALTGVPLLSNTTIPGPPSGPNGLVEFDLNWQIFPGHFGALGNFVDSIFILTVDNELAIDNTGFGPQGDWVGSDNVLGGCFNTLCRMTGFWEGSASRAVPEPSAMLLLLLPLLFVVFRSRA